MTSKTKILLAISFTAFVVGSTGVLWGIGFPIGAVCFGLFLISKLLEKETALFNQEQAEKIAMAERQKALAPELPQIEKRPKAVLASALSH